MFSADDAEARAGTDEGSRTTPVHGADGWSYLPFERNEETREHHITLIRDEDGETVEMTLPSFVERGDELGQIALLVIQARERWRDLKGLGA
ncbi:MAG: hypothetical protein JO153_07230 [Solirubrobacterales bacterium]|nr:hypothetical protein [Solirubrobacterales bacterium]